MLHRLATSTLLALCLVLTSLAAVVAETRMAAAGGYCGTGAPQILLDSAGLPILDADGTAITPVECEICHLAMSLGPQSPATDPALSILQAASLPAPSPPPILSLRLDSHARAPPHAV
ncbi:hypothetical protein [Gymnodinialimonas hymeniacidonis]|uniref:hypothetical protein n=1 Tax=Gymnodinialimonas hymeniacidonis TaxID=3126508 RepID=UPI0034C6744F